MGKSVGTNFLLVSFYGSNIIEMIFFRAVDPLKREVEVSIPYISIDYQNQLKSTFKKLMTSKQMKHRQSNQKLLKN